MADLSARDRKLVQYLNEAYGKEKELETALQAHIGMTTRAAYRNRLRTHLSETKRHARDVERRVKKLGGTPQTVPIEGLDPLAKGAGAAVELVGRAAAAAKGPLHAMRGTSEQERMLKNAKSEYADEHEEIATYTAIETLAVELGDTETAKLARAIRREEESMASFIERQLPALTKAVVQAEVPPAQRRAAATSNRGSGAKRSGSARSARARRSGGSAGTKATRAKATRTKAARAKTTRAKTTRARATPVGASRRKASTAKPPKASRARG